MSYTGPLNANIFEDLIKDLCKYFDKMSVPPKGTQLAWFDKLNGLPAADVEAAFEKLKDTEKYMPKNLPKNIKEALVAVWKDQGKDDSRVWKDYGPCPDCGGSGVFDVLVYYSKMKIEPYIMQYHCGACDNYLNLISEEGARRRTADQLRADGYTFKPGRLVLFHDMCQIQKPVPTFNVRNLANNLADHMPGVGNGRHLTQAEKEIFVNAYTPQDQVAV